MIKRAVVLQTEVLVQQEIALRSEMPWAPRPEVALPMPQPGPEIPDVGLGLKDIARRAAMAAEKAVITEVLEKVKWNRAEAAHLLATTNATPMGPVAASTAPRVTTPPRRFLGARVHRQEQRRCG